LAGQSSHYLPTDVIARSVGVPDAPDYEKTPSGWGLKAPWLTPVSSLHFGVRNICFELFWRRRVTVLKPLVLSDYLRAEQ